MIWGSLIGMKPVNLYGCHRPAPPAPRPALGQSALRSCGWTHCWTRPWNVGLEACNRGPRGLGWDVQISASFAILPWGRLSYTPCRGVIFNVARSWNPLAQLAHWGLPRARRCSQSCQEPRLQATRFPWQQREQREEEGTARYSGEGSPCVTSPCVPPLWGLPRR